MKTMKKIAALLLTALLLCLSGAALAEGVGSPVIPPHEHRGGTATCTERAVCAVCGEAYGEIDPDNHEWGEWTDNEIQNGQMLQKRVCALDQSHVDWQYAPIPEHEHTGGTATCTEQAVCDICGEPYGEPLGHDWGNWKNDYYDAVRNRMIQQRVCQRDKSHVEQHYGERLPYGKNLPNGTKVKAGNKTYQVVSGNLTLVSVDPGNSTSIRVPDMLRINGEFYKVTTIASNAFRNCGKVKKITLGKYVTKIKAKAFSGCTSLNLLKFRTTETVSVNKKAFKGLGKTQLSKIEIQVNEKMTKSRFKSLKQALTKAGAKATNAKKDLNV